MRNKQLKNEYSKNYHWEHRAAILARKRKYNLDNKDKNKEYYQKNREKILMQTGEYAKKNREKANEANRRYRMKYPNKKRSERLRREFGMTLEQYQNMSIKQDNKCAICKKQESRVISKNGKISDLAVDHCHVTGRIRGLLCAKCNTAIGLLNEDINIINNCVNYLIKEGNT